ncbi:hypothetical protein [Streptomyces sp. NPDC005209]|uniref:hypothetical protein n=1 Tax=Streptomyces sp. NPDC005209 TaxID=3156715 RepID=UPI0033AC6333
MPWSDRRDAVAALGAEPPLRAVKGQSLHGTDEALDVRSAPTPSAPAGDLYDDRPKAPLRAPRAA